MNLFWLKALAIKAWAKSIEVLCIEFFVVRRKPSQAKGSVFELQISFSGKSHKRSITYETLESDEPESFNTQNPKQCYEEIFITLFVNFANENRIHKNTIEERKSNLYGAFYINFTFCFLPDLPTSLKARNSKAQVRIPKLHLILTAQELLLN